MDADTIEGRSRLAINNNLSRRPDVLCCYMQHGWKRHRENIRQKSQRPGLEEGCQASSQIEQTRWIAMPGGVYELRKWDEVRLGGKGS